MKIKIFSTFYYPNIIGGGEISTQLLAEGLVKNNVEVEVVTLGEKHKNYIHNGVKIKVINCRFRSKIYKEVLKRKKAYKLLQFIIFLGDFIDIFLKKKLEKELDNCDIIHITNYHYYSGIPLIYRLQNKNIKIIQSIRAPIFQENKNFLKKIWATYSKKIYSSYNTGIIYHFPTKYMHKYFKNKNIKLENYFIIGNTVDIKSEAINTFKQKKIDICYSGVLEEYKGIRTLIKAVEILKNNLFSLKVVFIGKGSLEQEVDQNKILITGWLTKEENYKKIKESKVLVLPSEWDEAFGRVLIEAVQLGTIVVGSDSGAIPEVLNYNKKYIFETKNYKELGEKVERILNLTEEEYEEEVRNLRKEMDKYSYENHISEFIKKYKELLGEKI